MVLGEEVVVEVHPEQAGQKVVVVRLEPLVLLEQVEFLLLLLVEI
jgi:hypothetical protein